MNDAQFLIEIIVRARREIAGVMDKAVKDVDKLTGAEERRAKQIEKVTKATNTSAKSAAELRKQYVAYTKELEKGNRDTDVAIKQLGRFGAEFDKLARRAKPGSKIADDLLKAADATKKLTKEIQDRAKAEEAAERTLSAAKKKIVETSAADLIKTQKAVAKERERIEKELQSRLDKITADIEKARVGVRKERERRERESNERITREIEAAYKERDEVDKAYDQLAQQRAANRKSIVLELLAEVARDEKSRAKDRAAIAAVEDEETIKRAERRVIDARTVDEELEKEATRSAAAREAIDKKSSDARQKSLQKDIEQAGQERLINLQRVHDQRNLRDEVDQTVRSFDDFIDRVRLGQVTGTQVRTGLAQHASQLSSANRRTTTAFGAGSDEALFVGGRELEARDLIRSLGRESDTATHRVNNFRSSLAKLLSVDPEKLERLERSIEQTEDKLGKASFAAIHFAGVLRSLVYVGAIVFFQELTSAAIALAGALLAVASTAVQAGGAIVGALAAGAAEALPIIGLLGAAWGRVGAIFKAVQQNIKAQTTATADNTKAAKAQTDAAQRQADAADRLKKAQAALGPAYREARRQIEDLMAAQRSAELQARRSALSQSEAQIALQSALRSGDVGSIADLRLRVDEAAEDVTSSRTQLFRAGADARTAQSRGPGGQPNVVAAREAVKQARRDLERARQDTQDTLDQVSTAQTALQQMLADLSPAELELYKVLNRVVTRYREVFTGEGGVLESITTAFTFGARRVLSLLEDDRLIGAARKLADTIGFQLRRVFAGLSGRGGRSFIASIADDARRNLPLFVSLAIEIGKIAGAIAQAGGPALTRFLDFFLTLATRSANATGSDSGLQRLTDFFLKGEAFAEDIITLTIAVGELFAALVGSGADEGQTAILAITEAVRKATVYIQDNKDDVRQFFKDAVQATGFIAEALGELAVGLFKFFKSKQVEDFAHAFTRTFLPAILTVLTAVGLLTSVFLKFAGSGPGSVLLQFLIIMGGIAKVIGPLIALFARLGRAVGLLLGMEKVVVFFNRFLFLLGPIGLAISAVIAIFAILNSKFHLIDKFKELFTSASEKSREAADKLTDSINRQVEALRRQRDAELARQGSRLALSRAEIAAQRATEEAKKIGGIDLDTGAIQKGVKATDARRDASLNLKQALLDERQARVDLADARKADQKGNEEAIGTSKKTLAAAKESVTTLRDERTAIEKRIDAAKRERDLAKELLDKQVPGTRDYTIAQEQLKDAQDKLKDAQSDLQGNTKNLRREAERAIDSFRRWRSAVKHAGSGTESFSDDVHASMDSVVSDVNDVLVEFGAKKLNFKTRRQRKPSSVEGGDATAQLRPGDTGLGGFQRGGMIPGAGDGDKVPIMAESGEGFINKAATAWLGGERAINAINNMVPRFGGAIQKFARGGIVPIPGMPGESIDRRILPDVLSLIRRYKLHISDGYAPTGHKAAGEHPLGLAIDAGPGRGGSWDLVDKLAKWAEPVQNQPRPPFRWVGYDGDAGHGRGNHIHLSWLHDGIKTVQTLGGKLGGALNILNRKVTGPSGALKDILQGSVNRVVKAGNTFLDKKSAELGPSSTGLEDSAGSLAIGKEGSRAEKVFDYFVGRGLSEAQAAGITGVFGKESGYSTTVRNSRSGATGLAQWLGARLTRLLSKDNWQSLQTQLDYVWEELTGSEHAALVSLRRAKSPGSAASIFDSQYERSDAILDAVERANSAYSSFSGGANRTKGGNFAVGGEVPGKKGQAVNIVAHAKEWVLNTLQQSKLAKLVGTTVGGLKSMLGFGGGHGSFAKGGEVEPFTISPDLGLGTGSTFKEIERANKAIAKMGSSLINSKGTDALTKSFAALLGENGLFDLLTQSVDRLTTTLSDRLAKLTFKIDKAGNVVQNLSSLSIANKTVDNLEKVGEALQRQAFIVDRDLQQVRERLAGHLSKNDRTQLKAVETNLEKRLADVTAGIAQNLSDRFNAVEAVIQNKVDAAQAVHDSSTFLSGIQTRMRAITGDTAAALFGLPTPLQIQKVQADALNVQADSLEKAAKAAEKAGHNDTATNLRRVVLDLRTQAIEAIAQGLRDEVAGVEDRASKTGAKISLSNRSADIMERLGNAPGAFALRGQALAATGGSISSQITSLEALQGAANRSGNFALSEELAAKLDELRVQLEENALAIKENTVATRDAAIAAITSRGSFLGSVFAGIGNIFTGLDTLSGTPDPDRQRGVLERAGKTLGETGVGLADQLFSGFGIDLRGLNPAQIAQKLLGLDFDSIESGMTVAEKAQFEGLIGSIIDNTTSTVSNTQAIQDLTTPLAQTFASSAWQLFRRAVFNGSNGLLPQFSVAVPSLAGGADILSDGFVRVHRGETVVAAQVDRSGGSAGDTIYVQTTTPTVMYDPVDQARQLAHEYKKRK